MKKVLSVVLASAIIASVGITGCSKNEPAPAQSGTPAAQTTQTAAPAKKITLRVAWWGNQVRNERTQKAMDLYNKNNPNVSFEGEFVAWDGYWDKLATQSAANNLPDVIQQDYAYIGQYTSKKLMEDLNSYVKSGVLNTKDISENVIASGTVDGGFYALSLGTNSQCLYIDPAAFQKAGVTVPKSDWTWKDFEDVLTKVAKGSGMVSEPLWFSDPNGLLEYMVRQTGKTLYSKDGTALGFDDAKIVEELYDRALRLTKAGVYPKPDTLTSVKAIEDNPISKGTAFLGSGWSNQLVGFATAAKKPLNVIQLPAGSKPGAYLKPSQFFSVSSKSANKEESVKFINFFTNDIEVNKILLAERGVPVSSKVRDGIKSLVDENTQKTFDFIALAEKNSAPIDAPEPPGAAEVKKACKNFYDEVLFEKTSPKDAAAKYMKQANEILAKNKK